MTHGKSGRRLLALKYIALGAVLGLLAQGCASVPIENPALTRAKSVYEKAQSDPRVTANAAVPLYEAGQRLKSAEMAATEAEKSHLAYLAEKQTAIALATAEQKLAEAERAKLAAQKDQILLEQKERQARKAQGDAQAMAQEAEKQRMTAEQRAREAEAAQKLAEARRLEVAKATKETEMKIAELEKTRREAEMKTAELQRTQKEAELRTAELEKTRKEAELRTAELEKTRKEAEMRTAEAIEARKRAEAATAQARSLEQELADLKAKKTDRGFVLTLGDVLFATGKADLMPGAQRTIDQLAAFLNKYPTRKVVAEGHTDSVGSDAYNLKLSQQRAESVLSSILARGISADRVTAKGQGELYPVASNENAAGRQQNRRVEIIILSEEETPAQKK